MQEYLKATEIIDWQHPKILELAIQLSTRKNEGLTPPSKGRTQCHPQVVAFQPSVGACMPRQTEDIAKACFEWVRDNIKHSSDYQMNPVTCRASEVLQYQTGYCFAKSHLLAALLRANNIPAGFCYQRLSVFDDGAPYSLHGFNAVYLPQYGWYRVDARGNKIGVDAQFIPPQEKLAFAINFPEEVDCQKIFSQPLDIIVTALQSHQTWKQMLDNLPDVEKRFLIAYPN